MSDAAVYAEMIRPERSSKFLRRLAPDGDCLMWSMAKNPAGYGVFRIGFDGRRFTCSAHRVAWMLANRMPVPDGMEIDHTCRRPSCCNPSHLEAVIRRENVARSFGRSLTTQAATVHSGAGSIHVRHRAGGDRFLATWRERLADGSTIQRGQTFATHAEAEAHLVGR